MKRRNLFFGDDWPFGGGFPDFEEIDKVFDDLMKDLARGRMQPGKPLVYGFSMQVGPDGKPRFQEFGNVDVPQGKMKNEREPLVDVIEHEKEITVVAELPGVDKDKIKLTTQGTSLIVHVTDPEHKYFKQVRLPTEVEEDSAKATLKNGILQVVLTKLKPSKPRLKEIKIEASGS